jgi:hypothetical protein
VSERISERELREIVELHGSVGDAEQVSMARELLSLRERVARRDAVGAADAELAEATAREYALLLSETVGPNTRENIQLTRYAAHLACRAAREAAGDKDDVRFVKVDVAASASKATPKLTDIGRTIECCHPVHLAAVALADQGEEGANHAGQTGLVCGCRTCHWRRENYRAAVSAAQPARDEAERIVDAWVDRRNGLSAADDELADLKARIRAALAAARSEGGK